MMLQPDHLQPEGMNWRPTHADYSSVQTGQQLGLTEPHSEVDALLQSLMPPGVSPAKRAMIERLVTLWVAKSSRLDVA